MNGRGFFQTSKAIRRNEGEPRRNAPVLRCRFVREPTERVGPSQLLHHSRRQCPTRPQCGALSTAVQTACREKPPPSSI